MGNGRTDQLNAFVTLLSSPVAAPDLTIEVDVAPILAVPYYLVIDPLNPEREYVLVTGAAGNILTVTRSLPGTGSNTHLAGEPVIVAPMAQHFEDIWDIIDGLGATVDHDDLLNVTEAQHHTKYLDAEAIAAVGPHTTLHSDLTDVGALPSAHHVRYADAEAIAAVDNETYLKLTGGVLSGFLTLSADPTVALHAATKQYVDAAVPVGIGSWDLDAGTADSRPGPGLWRRNNAVPASVTFLYWDFISKAGVNLDNEVLNFKTQNVIYLRSYDGQRVEAYLVTADAVDGINYARIAVTLDQVLIPINVGDETFISTFGGGAADNFYLRLDASNSPTADISWGGNKIINVGQGTGATDAANLDNIDAKIVVHDAIVSAHHARYLDTEAVAAMNPISNVNPLHHNRYTDSEADARADLLDHDHATPIAVHADIPAIHHPRYTDAEAIAAVGIPGVGTFLPLTGGTLTGFLSLHANPTAAEHAANKAYVDLFLPLGGGTMLGDIDMNAGNFLITNMRNPTNPQDAASKFYVDANHIIGAEPVSPKIGDIWVDPSATGVGLFLPLVGGVMTGFITLNADPTAALHAATKQYVDAVPGFPEAPNDGQQYGRQSLNWTVVSPGGIPEAPNDGIPYGRQSLAWQQVIRKSGDTINGRLTFVTGTKYQGYDPNPFEFQGRDIQVTDSGSEPGAIGKVGDIVLNYGGGTPQGVWIRSSFGGNANNWHHIAGRFL